jgi:hydroxypyruvate isomerase
VVLLLEPLNSVLDHRGYFLDHSQMGFEIIRHVGSPQMKVLYDIYHMSMMGEDVMAEMESNLEWVGYLHVADVPGRHQPGTGKIDYRGIADWLERVRFDGFIGMEFYPQGLDHFAAHGQKVLREGYVCSQHGSACGFFNLVSLVSILFFYDINPVSDIFS